MSDTKQGLPEWIVAEKANQPGWTATAIEAPPDGSRYGGSATVSINREEAAIAALLGIDEAEVDRLYEMKLGSRSAGDFADEGRFFWQRRA